MGQRSFLPRLKRSGAHRVMRELSVVDPKATRDPSLEIRKLCDEKIMRRNEGLRRRRGEKIGTSMPRLVQQLLQPFCFINIALELRNLFVRRLEFVP